MARNGSGVYSLPAGSTVANGDTSDATDLNTPLADIAADLNTARPVVAGGTGATSAAAARTNLDARQDYGESSLVATTSGTTFTQAIPAGVRRITVILRSCSLATTSQMFLVQLGDSGGFETTGYLSRSVINMEGTPIVDDRATGFNIWGEPDTTTVSATMVIERVTATAWNAQHYGIRVDGRTIQGYGTKTLSDDLTQVRLTSTSGNFDGGSVLFRWEF